jgi:hypothetical protein
MSVATYIDIALAGAAYGPGGKGRSSMLHERLQRG